MDSIDAGQTPSQLQYIRDRWDELIYFPESNKLRIDEHFESPDMREFDVINYGDSSFVRFDPSSNKFTFYAFFAEYRRRLPLVDSAEFIYVDGDTILRIHRDTMPVDLIKYYQGACVQDDPYSHLFKSRFIAGIYYNANDPQHRHHIIFTKCGNMEGCEFISPDFKSYQTYSILIGPDYDGRNSIHFWDESNHSMNAEAVSQEWSVNKDTLRIGKTTLIKSN